MNLSPNDNELLFQKLASYCLNELNANEVREIELWINANEVNKKQYQSVQQLLQQTNTVEDLEIDTDKGWLELNARVSNLRPSKSGKVHSMRWYWAAAAVLVGFLVGGWIFFQSADVNNAVWIARTGFDTLQLADGSLVIGGGSATVKYRQDFNKGNREVQLEGNAFFKVHRDTTQPFSISINQAKITVLGTQFTISQKAQGFEVRVTEGKVKTELSNKKGEVILTRGKMVIFNETDNQFQVQDFAEASMLKYDNESLQVILKDIFLAKGLEIKADQTLATMKLTVDFVKSQPAEILQALELLTQAKVLKTGASQYQLIKN